MGFQANVLKVMIASPGDVAAERDIITDELYRWNNANAVSRELILQPVRWETHSSPEMGAHPQQLINDHLLLDTDIVIGIFGTRIGTATPEFVSGSVEEIKKHVAAGKLAMLYFSHVPVDPNSIDQGQWRLLQDFKEECKTGGLYGEYGNYEQLRTRFSHHLSIELNKAKYKWITRPALTIESSEPELDANETRLLLAVASDINGQILTGTMSEGFFMQTNGESFVEDSARSVAAWKRALRNLTQAGYLSQISEDIYEVTDEGFARADKELILLPLEISVSIEGPPDKPALSLHSNKAVTLTQIDFLLSSEVRISSTNLEEAIQSKANIPLDYSKVLQLYNSPRNDRDRFDNSGPAALRLAIISNRRRFDPILQVLLQSRNVNNTMWVEVVGAKTFSLK